MDVEGREGASLPGRELERVIRRAVELQFQAGKGREDRLPEAEVVRIGQEVGIEPHHVRRALAEYRSGSLAIGAGGGPDRLAPLLGPGAVRASRSVPGSPQELQDVLEEHFRKRESLQPVRRLPGMSLWEPAGGMLSAAQRALNIHGRRFELAKAGSVELAITELEQDRSLVTLSLDIRNIRADSGWGWFVLAFVLVVIPGFAFGPILGLHAGAAALLGAALAAALGSVGTRRSVRREADRVRLVAEGLLDRLESGEGLEELPPSWRELLS